MKQRSFYQLRIAVSTLAIIAALLTFFSGNDFSNVGLAIILLLLAAIIWLPGAYRGVLQFLAVALSGLNLFVLTIQ